MARRRKMRTKEEMSLPNAYFLISSCSLNSVKTENKEPLKGEEKPGDWRWGVEAGKRGNMGSF